MQKIVLACFTLAAALIACDPRATTPRATTSDDAPASSASAATSSPASTETQAHGRPLMTLEQADAAMSLADKCYSEASCDPAEAEKQYRIAADGGAKGLPCTYFYFGIRVMKDPERARACFERQFTADPGCKGSSSGLDRELYATMLIDAQGGPANPARAKALFNDCNDDAVAHELEKIAQTRATLGPGRKPLDFCDDIGGTTITIGECHTIDREKNKADRRRVDHMLSKKLDADALALAKRAEAAHAAYAEREGEAASDKYRGGSIRSNAWASKQNELTKARLETLLHLFDYEPATPAADVAKIERDLDKNYREASSSGDAEQKKIFAGARKAWAAYRDAEIALYAKVFGEKFGKKEVERDVKAMLTAKYNAELDDVQKP